MYLPHFEYLAPDTAEELVAVLSQHEGKAQILAGGTDLLGLMKNRQLRPDFVVDINRVASMSGIVEDADGSMLIGAATKLIDMMAAPLIRERYPALCEAVRTIGSVQVRSTGSLGGNICNASPAADSPPALIALGARVNLLSQRGQRQMSVEDFITGNGQTALAVDECLESIVLPSPLPHSVCVFDHVARRDAMEIALVNVAVNVALVPGSGDVDQARIVMGGVGPHPIRAVQAEQLLHGNQPGIDLIEQTAVAAAADAQPRDDFRASAVYKREMTRVLVNRTLRAAIAGIE
ncbi:MAG: xanthine dehydrogenase family protein subunit M [Gammaproteobacteria bacterium]|nr:xanthine dehydrogenase family protein subunit M [Gammaproteobacteria bacterium]